MMFLIRHRIGARGLTDVWFRYSRTNLLLLQSICYLLHLEAERKDCHEQCWLRGARSLYLKNDMSRPKMALHAVKMKEKAYQMLNLTSI